MNQFTPNLFLLKNTKWGLYREDYIYDLLKSVDIK